MKIKITLLLAICFLSFISCGNDPDPAPIDNIDTILMNKENSLTPQEKIRELLILVNGDYAQLACIFNCSPSTVKRLNNGETFATSEAEIEINEHYSYFITKGNSLEKFKANCISYKWYNHLKSFISHWWFWVGLLVLVILLEKLGADGLGIMLGLVLILFCGIIWILNIFGGKPNYDSIPDNYINNMDTVWETKSTNKLEITYEEAFHIMEALKQFELKNNKDFYNTLLEASNNYFSEVTREFLDKEYSMSGSFSEIGIISKKTSEERFEIWNHKINNYFSSLAYTRFIISKTDNFSKNVNRQRKKELEDVFNYIKEDSLVLKKVGVDVFKASEDAINQSILRANESIQENLKEIAFTAVDGAALVVTGGAAARVIEAIETASFVDLGVQFIIPKEDKTKKILEEEYVNFIERNNIDFTDILDQNTNDYYNKLKELIESRSNGKILY